MLRVFIGYDHRQPISYTTLQHSILTNASKPISVAPLIYKQLPLNKDEFWRDDTKTVKDFYESKDRKGLTPFTFSRFLVPYLCNYEGVALFLDIDMLLRDDISKLFDLFDPKYTVQVVKNVKQYEWASAILFNCEKCKILTPEFVDNAAGLHAMTWITADQIGSLPSEWNHLVGYDKPRDDAKLVHFTQGIPCHPEIGDCEYASEWRQTTEGAISTAPWMHLMGGSVHAEIVDGKPVPKLRANKVYVGVQEAIRAANE